MVKIVMKIIPDAKTSEKREPSRPQFLDDKLIGQPTVALSLARKEITRCSEMAGETLQKLINLVKGETNEQLEEVMEQGHDVVVYVPILYVWPKVRNSKINWKTSAGNFLRGNKVKWFDNKFKIKPVFKFQTLISEMLILL